MLDAVIFDFDGTLVDTEPLHFRAFRGVMAEFGVDFDWEFYRAECLGLDDRDALALLARRFGVAADSAALADLARRKAAAFAAIALESEVPVYPGALELLKSLDAAGIALGLCSGSVAGDILPILERLGVRGRFQRIVSADDVEHSKPDPASYRLIIERLSTSGGVAPRPERTVAIEDSPVGVESARGAGLRVVAVTSNYPPDILAAANKVVGSIGKIDLELLAGLVRAGLGLGGEL